MDLWWKCPECDAKVDFSSQLSSVFDPDDGEADFAVEKDCGLWFHTIMCDCGASWGMSISRMCDEEYEEDSYKEQEFNKNQNSEKTALSRIYNFRIHYGNGNVQYYYGNIGFALNTVLLYEGDLYLDDKLIWSCLRLDKEANNKCLSLLGVYVDENQTLHIIEK